MQSRFIVYHKVTTHSVNVYDLESSAKRRRTQLNNAAGGDYYAYASDDAYNNDVVHPIKVQSLMTGEEVEIASNTPWSCRPDSDAYWSS